VIKKNINKDLWFYFDYFNHKTNPKHSNDFCQKHTYKSNVLLYKLSFSFN